MDFSLILYIIICVVIGGYAVSTLYQKGQSIGAMMTLVLLILIFTFYALRWFQGGELKGKQGQVQWPPIVNVCPDFMVSGKDANGNIYCYDVNNTYNLRETASTSADTTPLTINGRTGQYVYTAKNLAVTTPTKLNQDTGTSKKWPLLNKMSNENIAAFVSVGDQKYLRWEGVWDGRKATPELAPLL